MNLQSDGMQVGFLVGLYFLASAIVALTLVYFSRPRPQNQTAKNTPEKSKSDNAGANEPAKSGLIIRIQKLLKPKNRVRPAGSMGKNEMSARPSVSLIKLADKPASKVRRKNRFFLKKNPPTIKTSAVKTDTTGNTDSPQHQSISLPEPAGVNDFVIDNTLPDLESQKKGSPSLLSLLEKPLENKNSVPGPSVVDPVVKSEAATEKTVIPEPAAPVLPKAAAAPIILDDTLKNQQKPDLTQPQIAIINTPVNTNPVEPPPEIKSGKETPVVDIPSLKIENEKAGNNEMEENPQDTKSSGFDLSDLFAGNDEEEVENSESGRLAKELSDVDASDILDNSLNLINELKKTKES
jgi:hypothetical protein